MKTAGRVVFGRAGARVGQGMMNVAEMDRRASSWPLIMNANT